MTTTTKKKPAMKTPEPMGAAVAAGKETMETVFKAGAEAASQGVEKAVAMSQEHVAAAIKAGSEAFKGYEDVVTYGKDNVDAVMKANAVFVKGMQDINKLLFGLAQATLDENVAATKKMLGCKSLKDALDMQADLAKACYTKAINDSRTLTDLSVKVAEDATAPLAKQVNVTVEKFTKQMAA